MDAKQFFFERYHGFQEYPERLVEGLDEHQLRKSPHAAFNPIAWALWHIARCEDVAVNRLLADHEQVLDQGRFSQRLGTPDRRIGTGMDKDEVAGLCAALDLQELRAYRVAITQRTVAVVGGLPLAELSRELTAERLQQVILLEGAGGTAGPSIVETYLGHTSGWLLGHLALTHHYYHIGQAFGIRAMHGAANPW